MLFKKVIGQQEIKRKLIQTVQENRISHAQLFHGKEGTGGLQLALAYAQYINCLNKSDEDACGTCTSCLKYQKLIHPDLHFVFPVIKAENVKKPVSDDFIQAWRDLFLSKPYFTLNDWYNQIKVENKQGSIFEAESEKIIRKLSLKAFESEYKTMIIWLPEKMNIIAANKLLKLIEEPPPKTLLFMAALQTDNILPTILSRTLQIYVPEINNEDLEAELRKNNNFSVSEIKNILRISGGSYSKALSNIDKSEEIIYNFNKFQELMRLVFKGNAEEMLKWVDNIASLGREKQKSFLQNGLRLVRENFVNNLKQPELQYMSVEEQEWAVKFSPYINERNIVELNEEFNKAFYHIERNANGKIVFFDLALKLSSLIKK